MTKLRSSVFILALAGTQLAIGCRSPDLDASAVKVINGVDASTEYPEVVIFMNTYRGQSSNCTGTFLSPSIMITAAHCVYERDPTATALEDTQFGDPGFGDSGFWDTLTPPPAQKSPAEGVVKLGKNGESATALAKYIHPGYIDDPASSAMTPHDIAIVVFPEGTHKSFAKLAAETAQATEILQVGYGCAREDGAGFGVKRKGKNTISEAGSGTLRTERDEANTKAVNCPGDSGGPIFKDGTHEIVGLASTALYMPGSSGEARNVASDYADVRSEFSQSFLGSLAQEGVTVPGISKEYIGATAKSLPEEAGDKTIYE